MGTTPSTDTQPPAPVACSLDARELRTQEQRWLALLRDAGIDRTAVTDGVTLTFRADEDAERELRALVAVENDCCSWAHWEVRADGDGRLVMHVGTTGDGVAVLQSIYAHPDGMPS